MLRKKVKSVLILCKNRVMPVLRPVHNLTIVFNTSDSYAFRFSNKDWIVASWENDDELPFARSWWYWRCYTTKKKAEAAAAAATAAAPDRKVFHCFNVLIKPCPDF